MLSLLFMPLNDVTTTPSAPPAFVALVNDRRFSGVAWVYDVKSAEKQRQHHPELAPKIVPWAPSEAFGRVVAAAKSKLDWEIVVVDDSKLHLEAVATTPLMKFKDFIVIEVRQPPGGGTGSRGSEIHMRSKSWKGRSDLGANAKRITQFLSTL